MEIDTSQSSFKVCILISIHSIHAESIVQSDITMEGSVATIRGGSLMQIEVRVCRFYFRFTSMSLAGSTRY